MDALLVIDMQPNLDAAKPGWLIGNVAREIRVAAEAGRAIVFLEYNFGSAGVPVGRATDRRLTGLVAEYDRAVVVHKPSLDGSEQAAAVLYQSYPGACGGEIRVAGVETDVCVAATVLGLAARLPGARIVVVGDACNVNYAGAGPTNYGQDKIRGGGNVSILRVPAAP